MMKSLVSRGFFNRFLHVETYEKQPVMAEKPVEAAGCFPRSSRRRALDRIGFRTGAGGGTS